MLNKTGVKLNGDNLEGYAVVFYDKSDPNTQYQMGDNVYERVDPQCEITFGDNTICDGDHDERAYLGGTKAGTLTIRRDNKGVFYSVVVPDTSSGRDYKVLANRGDITGSSFRFDPDRSQYKISRENGNIIKSFVKLHIERVSPVYQPAYKASVRNERSEDSEAMRRFEQQENLLDFIDRLTT